MITTAEEKASPFVCPEFQFRVFYAAVEKCELAKTFKMKRFTIRPFYIFVGQSTLHRVGAGWEGSFCLRYYVYFIPSHESLEDSISFAYRAFFLLYALLRFQAMMMMAIYLRVTSLCENTDIVKMTTVSVSRHMYVCHCNRVPAVLSIVKMRIE